MRSPRPRRRKPELAQPRGHARVRVAALRRMRCRSKAKSFEKKDLLTAEEFKAIVGKTLKNAALA